MIQKTPEMMGNLMIAGAAGAFFLSTLFATVVFDKPSANTTVAVQEIQLAMQVMPAEQHVEVWMDAVLPLHIIADIVNISKVNEDGSTEEGGLTDLFPVGGPATGKGAVTFKIKLLDRSLMPYIDNITQDVIPMAYIKEETLSEFVRSILKLAAVSLKCFSLISWMIVLSGLGLIGGGVAMLYMERKKSAVDSSIVIVE